MSLRTILACSCVLMFSACGNLGVHVDVVDPEFVRAEIYDEAIRKTFREVSKAQPGEFAAQLDSNFGEFQVEVIRLSRSYEGLAQSFGGNARTTIEASASGLRDAVSTGSIVSAKDRLAADLERRAQAIREAPSASSWNGRGNIPLDLRSQLLEFLAQSKQLSAIQLIDLREISRDVRQIADRAAAAMNRPPLSQDTSPVAKAVIQQEATTTAVAQKSIIQGAELSNTEFAYVVASAPDSVWHRRYNEAYGSGTFGNVDVVIRMNSTADFSVKGMRFDASTVAQVASKVVTQSILLGAQMAGVPVASATSGTQSGGDALSKQSADLSAVDQSLASREAVVDAQRAAIRSVAKSILGAVPQLDTSLKDKPASDATRAALHSSVDSTVNALKSQISLQNLR